VKKRRPRLLAGPFVFFSATAKNLAYAYLCRISINYLSLSHHGARFLIAADAFLLPNLVTMHSISSGAVPRRALSRGLAVGVFTLLLAACGPSDVGASRLKSLETGADRSLVVSTMGNGPLASNVAADAPRLISGFRRQAFIVNGRTIEVLWYREAPGSLNDPILKTAETPIVIEADTLVGWGWKFYPQFAAENNIPDPERDRKWQDSSNKAALKSG